MITKGEPSNKIIRMEEKHKISPLELYLCFFRIGCFTFGGGWAIVAQMEEEFVNRREMITKDELLEMVAVGKSVPGIMITNIGYLFGYHAAGLAGGTAAVFGITSPAVLILSVVTLFYNSFKSNYWVHAALTGIRAAVIPIIGASALSLSKEALRTKSAAAICAAALAVCLLTDISNIMMVLTAVAAGLLWHAAGRRKGKRG